MTVSLACGDHTAEVSQCGAALVSYRVAGVPVVCEWPPGPPAYAGAVLAPWPNRVAGGRWPWSGATLQLPVNDDATGAALHGLVFGAVFEVLSRTSREVALRHVIVPSEGYPFSVVAECRYVLSATGLRATVTASNVGDAPAPVGLGAHPYLDPGGDLEDAALHLPSGQALDLRAPIDEAYTDLSGDDGAWSATLHRADGWTVSMHAGGAARWLMVYTADTLPEPQRRAGVALEPMTCPPNALGSHHPDLRVLRPGESLTLEWALSARSSADLTTPPPGTGP